MKKACLIIALIALFLMTGCESKIVANGGIVVRGNLPTQPPPSTSVSAPPGETIVYVTKTGEKYHEENCSALSDSCIPVLLTQAKLEGKQPCSRCLGSHQTLD